MLKKYYEKINYDKINYDKINYDKINYDKIVKNSQKYQNRKITCCKPFDRAVNH